MKTISVINYKGGVGKTTVTANLLAGLALRGFNVLGIDLDPQASLTFSLVSVDKWERDYATEKTIKNWYDAFIDKDSELDLSRLIIRPPKINRFTKGNIDLICSHLALINVDLELATHLIGTSRQLGNNFLRVHSRLKQGLHSLNQEQYDFVFIDCPPNFNIVTKSALVASDYLLVPAKPDYLSTLGIEELTRHVDELVSDYNKYSSEANDNAWESILPEVIGVLFSMITVRSGEPILAQQQYIQQVKSRDIPTFRTFLRKNDTIYAHSPEDGIPVILQYGSGQTYRNVLSELKHMVSELLERIDEK